MKPRRFPLNARLAGCALSLILALSACTDRELPTAVPTVPDSPSMSVVEGSQLVSVSAGDTHTCAVKTDGTVHCWGGNSVGQLNAPGGTFTQVSAGGLHTCGVSTDGTVDCWGRNLEGETDAPDATFTQVSAGGLHTCGVKSDGTVDCWGDNDFGRAEDQAGTFTQVSAGGLHTCAVKIDGTVDCWGNNATGQLNAPAGTFTQVSAGHFHTCGVETDGTIVCWGVNGAGQLNAPAGTFTQVSTRENHNCALKTDGGVECWGDTSSGKTDAPAGTFTQVSAGGSHSCGVKTDGTVTCWGASVDGPEGSHAKPGVSAGASHTCAVKTDGTVACWGSNDFERATPPPGTFSQVSANRWHTCAVRSDRTVACWGWNNSGEATAPPGTFTHVSAGILYSCGVRTDGTLDCWGANDGGQAPDPAGTFTQVSAGGKHTCAVKTDGTLECWGAGKENLGGFGLFGQAIPPAGTFTQVSAGLWHTCAVKTDGTVACWGDSFQGKTTVPAGTYTQVSAREYHTCALKTDGGIACWGDDAYGRATPPDGTFTQVSAGDWHTCGVRTDGTVACWGAGTPGTIAGSGQHAGQSTVPPELGGAITTTTTLSISPTTQQYSDSVTLTASVSPNTATGSVEFLVQDGNVWTSLGTEAVASGSASKKLQVTAPAGTYAYKAVFTPTSADQFAGCEDTETLEVTEENATIGYAAGNVAALQVSAPGGSLDANALTLAFTIKETEPDTAAATKGIGTITAAGYAGFTVSLAPLSGGASIALTCTAGAVTASGYGATRPYSCKNTAALPVNTYEVVATVTGDYYTGTYADAFTVFDPSLGFATGGGSFMLGGDKVNFGFTMKYGKNGTNLQGNLIAVRHYPDGTVSRLKANALGGLAIGEDASVPMGWASFNGKASYTKWDPTANGGAGAYVTQGNQSFTVYAEDRNNPGTGVDRIWLGAPGTLAMPGTLATAKTNTAVLTGGGIGVPHKAGRK